MIKVTKCLITAFPSRLITDEIYVNIDHIRSIQPYSLDWLQDKDLEHNGLYKKYQSSEFCLIDIGDEIILFENMKKVILAINEQRQFRKYLQEG